MPGGFLLKQECHPGKPHYKGDFAIFTDDPLQLSISELVQGRLVRFPYCILERPYRIYIPGRYHYSEFTRRIPVCSFEAETR
jgi:hypothetical protein